MVRGTHPTISIFDMHQNEPLSIYSTVIKPEWIDYNGHMNVAYYVLIFDEATDAYKSYVGIDDDYRQKHNFSTFAAELHVTYIMEVHLNDTVDIKTQLIDHDAKRHHFIHQMIERNSGDLCATMEVMSLHIDLTTRRTKPFPAEVYDRISDLMKRHAALPRPKQVGSVIGIRRK